MIKWSYHQMINPYLLAFASIVILACYFILIGKLVIALKHREYGTTKVQVLLLLIATAVVVGIYIFQKMYD